METSADNTLMELALRTNDAKNRIITALHYKGAEVTGEEGLYEIPAIIDNLWNYPPPPVSDAELDGYVNHLKETLTNDQDRQNYVGSWIAMRLNYQDYEEFTLSQNGLRAIKTSDGHTYTFENDGAEISHLWDSEHDIMDLGSKPVRWVIYYYNANNIDDNVLALDWNKNCNIIYVFGLDVNLTVHDFQDNSVTNTNYELLTFDFIDDFNVKSSDNNWSYFCSSCISLQKLPDNLNTSSGTDFSYFCQNCPSLQKLPDNLNTSKGTQFGGFCSACFSLQKLPENLDISSGTYFSYFCSGCYSLQKLPENLDTSKGTNFGNFCYDCPSLQKLPDNLDTSNGTYFSSFCSGCQSLQELPDNLDTSSGTNFNWFCNNCYSLQKLPDNLNTSSGTNFSNFCYYCYSLQKLPDNLDTSRGTSFSSFCSGCDSLTQANIKLAARDYQYLNVSGRLTVSSMRYMADNAPTVTSNTITIGETNIARANKYDQTIIETFTTKGWTVN